MNSSISSPGVRVAPGLAFFLCVAALSGCSLPYLVRQGAGEARILASARPVSEALSDPGISAEAKSGLRESERMLEFARRHALNVGDAYESYVDLGGRPLVYVLMAAAPDSLSSHTWTFPIVGEVPYKGFFDLPAARREQSLLEGRGLETRIAPVAAFSSVGWFRDPILSSFFEDGLGSHAETLFHELTHRTIFFASDLRFNENLANFVGQVAAVQYLQETLGPEAEELREYRARADDQVIFNGIAAHLKAELEVAFRAATRAERLAERERLFAAANQRLCTANFQSGHYRPLSAGISWGIPLLLSLDLYGGESALFQQAWKRSEEDLPRFLRAMQALPETGSGVDSLKEWLAAGPPSP